MGVGHGLERLNDFFFLAGGQRCTRFGRSHRVVLCVDDGIAELHGFRRRAGIFDGRVDVHDHAISGLFGGDPRAIRPNVNWIGNEQRDASIDSAIARHIGFVRRGDIRVEDVVDSNCDEIVRARL